MPFSGSPIKAIARLTDPAGSEILRAEAFDSALHPRMIGRAAAVTAPAWRLVHLERGTAWFLEGGEAFELSAPCVSWQPWGPDHRLRIAAGAVGCHALIGPEILSGAIGRIPEAPELRHTANRRAHVALSGRVDLGQAVAHLVNGIRHERETEDLAARTVIEALLRVVLILLWRDQGAPQPASFANPPAMGHLARFNALVEAHFHSRWTVARYAAALGISADRLTDICRRATDRSPKQVIDARVAAEARHLLVNSLHSIDQIAGILGYQNTPHFSRFFKAACGQPPGQFRRANSDRRKDLPDPPDPPAPPLSAWP